LGEQKTVDKTTIFAAPSDDLSEKLFLCKIAAKHKKFGRKADKL